MTTERPGPAPRRKTALIGSGQIGATLARSVESVRRSAEETRLSGP